jgi:uroporphyrinogen-III synthase
VTARAIRDAGFAVEVEAADSTAAGLAAALAGYYERRSASPHPEPGRKG